MKPLRWPFDERGMALPLVTAISLIVFLFLFTSLAHTVYSGESTALEWEMMRAQYAAESGIARIQERLRERSGWRGTLQTKVNGAKVITAIEGEDRRGIRVVSIGMMDRGVKQTIRVVLDPITYEMKEWAR